VGRALKRASAHSGLELAKLRQPSTGASIIIFSTTPSKFQLVNPRHGNISRGTSTFRSTNFSIKKLDNPVIGSSVPVTSRLDPDIFIERKLKPRSASPFALVRASVSESLRVFA
jgi:hypothetical protein